MHHAIEKSAGQHVLAGERRDRFLRVGIERRQRILRLCHPAAEYLRGAHAGEPTESRRLGRSKEAHGELVHACLQKRGRNQVMTHADEAGEVIHAALADERAVPIHLIKLRRGTELQDLRRAGLPGAQGDLLAKPKRAELWQRRIGHLPAVLHRHPAVVFRNRSAEESRYIGRGAVLALRSLQPLAKGAFVALAHRIQVLGT